MNKYYLIFLIALLVSCEGNEKHTPDKKTTMTIDKNVYDFGNLKEDEMYTGYFIVKNTGTITLAIYDVSTECGCTVIDSYKKLVEPKDTCMIRFSFNTLGKSGIQNKTISLVTNTDTATHFLKIKADVLK
jgi:hypothetical protein